MSWRWPVQSFHQYVSVTYYLALAYWLSTIQNGSRKESRSQSRTLIAKNLNIRWRISNIAAVIHKFIDSIGVSLFSVLPLIRQNTQWIFVGQLCVFFFVFQIVVGDRRLYEISDKVVTFAAHMWPTEDGFELKDFHMISRTHNQWPVVLVAPPPTVAVFHNFNLHTYVLLKI